jgi:hypothetical protein
LWVRIPAKARRGICEQDTLKSSVKSYLGAKSYLGIKSYLGAKSTELEGDNTKIYLTPGLIIVTFLVLNNRALAYAQFTILQYILNELDPGINVQQCSTHSISDSSQVFPSKYGNSNVSWLLNLKRKKNNVI